MNWLITILQKEARGRRFRPDDKIRFFTDHLKGKGKGVVLTPRFQKGRIVDWNGDDRRYVVETDSSEQMSVHPRNIVPETFSRPVETQPVPPSVPESVPEVDVF